jgi:hypothetical protein
MKVSRNHLKGIVKECLMEILAEGLLHNETSTPAKSGRAKKRRVTEDTLVEHIEPEADKFEAVVNETVSGLTNDPIMTSIFRDTAMTTLQNQLNGETAPQPSQHGELLNEQSTDTSLDDTFSEALRDRWASLAFAEKKIRP